MKIRQNPSPNFDERRANADIQLVVIHYTGTKALEDVLHQLCDDKADARVSAHYLIDEEGNIYQLVPEEKRAWHAGISYWHGETDINSISIGIELLNDGQKAFSDKQLASLALLCQDIRGRYKIPAQNVIGHSDIAPDRKQDPGPLFPWRKMSKIDIGIWPKPSLIDHFNAAAVAKNDKKLKNLFKKAGYETNKTSLPQLTAAFQSRFAPDEFGRNPDKPSAAMVARLRAYARQQKKQNRKYRKNR